MKKLLATLAVALLLLVAIITIEHFHNSTQADLSELTLQYALDLAHERRAEIVKPNYSDLTRYTYGFDRLLSASYDLIRLLGSEDV